MRTVETEHGAGRTGVAREMWEAWPVAWPALWVGALTAFTLVLLFGLAGIATGAHQVGNDARIVRWSDFGLWPLVLSVLGAFFSFVAAGWVAVKIAGILRSEPAMLHGAIAWLLAIPLIVVAAGIGGGDLLGSWLGGLGGPFWMPQPAEVDPAAANVARNGALGALAAMLLGLMGAVLGGWLASGEPMSIAYYKTRDLRGRPDYA